MIVFFDEYYGLRMYYYNEQMLVMSWYGDTCSSISSIADTMTQVRESLQRIKAEVIYDDGSR